MCTQEWGRGVLAGTALLAASPAQDTGLCLPSPQAQENEALLSNWVNSWAKQAAGGCHTKVQP